MPWRTIKRRLYGISIAEAVVGFLVIATAKSGTGDLIGMVLMFAGIALALLASRLPFKQFEH